MTAEEAEHTDTDTGWPDDDSKQVRTVDRRPAKKSRDDDDEERRRRFRPLAIMRFGRRAWWLAMAAAAVIIVVLIAGLVGALPHLGNPFAKQRVDKSQPVVLLSI